MGQAIKFISTIFLSILTLTSCLSLGGGADTVIKENSNKQLNKKAILFLHEAGATVGNSYQVTVMDYNDKFDTTEVGNTFTVDNDHGKTWLDSASINFTWLSNDTLQIDYDTKLRTFIQEKRVLGVIIIYQPR
jgi:hypothetical protein